MPDTQAMVATFNPSQVAEEGKKLYSDLYKARYEPDHAGEFLAIDVVSKKESLGRTAVEALTSAEKDHPQGFFYLVKIGATGIYKVSFGRSGASGWLFR